MNRDGRPDLAVANESSHSVSILLGNGDGTFQPARSIAVGDGPVFVALGDINRDGKLDVAVANFQSDDVSVLLNSDDILAPVTIILTVPDTSSYGWHNSAVQFTAVAADELGGSGVAETRCELDPATPPADFATLSSSNCTDVTASTEGIHTFFAASEDNAGNQETPVSQTVQIDMTAPSITGSQSPATNAQGWNNTSVTVSFDCSDNLSGIASCEPDQLISGEGANQSVTGTAVDQANNSQSTTFSGINIDKTPPEVTVTGVTAGATYTFGAIPAAGCLTSDSLSGVQSEATVSMTGGTSNGVGSFTASCSDALDNADNSGSATVSFNVIYAFEGFARPVDNLPAVNHIKAGKVVSVKFSLGGDFGLDILAAGPPVSQGIACDGSSPLPDSEPTVTAGSNGLSYDPRTDQYIYPWQTVSSSGADWSGSCRQLLITLDDGTVHQAYFEFK